ncbi:hypothetical protein ABZ815_01335 [Nonomuraea sp. NPDC047529]|uniref:hypothetical protein n=1 Tax=Nonomuraea sp. NPDC047529 TaxID=3155623 RepID=UPI00340E4E40
MLAGYMTHLLVAGIAVVPAGNDHGDGVGVSRNYFDYLISARDKPSRTPAVPTKAKPKVTCSYQRWWYANGLQKVGQGSADPNRTLSSEPVKDGAWYLLKCSNGSQKLVWLDNQHTKAAAEQLAQQAYKRIPITLPRVLTAPPRGRDALVGLPHWFYLAKGQWAPKAKRLSTGSVWAEATAKPQRMTVDTGEGHSLTCNGPGTAYDPARSAGQQSSTCSYQYQQPAQARQVTVSVTWGGTWHGSGGAGGTLPPITRSVTFPVRVVEAQALVTEG